MSKIKKLFKNKTLLITGGTGSFGNAMVKSLKGFELKEIRIFSRDEKKQYDMRKKFNNFKNISFYIGDIRNEDSIYEATKKVDFIFHAAALKQVPSCEFFPMEAIKTNVLGTSNVLKAAKKNDVKKTIVLSTDKAVYPINAMGQSKALMEKLTIAESRNSHESIFCITRYGNVMGSRGSVIPLFISQLKNESFKNLTITHKDMTRFLMTLDNSVELVFHAFTEGMNGDIFVKKQPASTVVNLAIALKELLNIEKKIKFIGIREGEKLHETLVSSEEFARTIDNKSFYLIKPDNRDLNYDDFFFVGRNKKILNDYTSLNTKQLDLKEIKKLILASGLLVSQE